VGINPGRTLEGLPLKRFAMPEGWRGWRPSSPRTPLPMSPAARYPWKGPPRRSFDRPGGRSHRRAPD